MADFSVYQDTDPVVAVEVNKQADGTDFDLTGYAPIEFFLEGSPDTSLAPLYSTATSGVVVVSAPAGTLNVQFAAAHLATPGDYRWRLEGVKAGKRTRLLSGRVSVLP